MKSILAIVLLSVFALVCGCAAKPSNSYSVSIDSAFTPEQTDLVLDSLRNWEVTLGNRLALTYSIADECSRNDKEDLICIHATTRAYVQSVSDDNGTVGFTIRNNDDSQPFGKNRKSNSSDVYIPTDDSYASNVAEMKQIIQHEFFHAMSGEHTKKGNLMYWNIGGASQVITCADLNQWTMLRDQFEIPCPTDMPLGNN